MIAIRGNIGQSRNHAGKAGRRLRAAALLASTALVGASMVALPQMTAAQVVWEGSVSEDWFDGDNWVGGAAPGANDNVRIDTVDDNPTLLSVDDVDIGNIDIGFADEGELTIDGGATLGSSRVTIGQQSGAIGRVLVTGAGTEWSTSSVLTVGGSGTGFLDILDGASVEVTGAGNHALGSSPDGFGAVTIAGEGSVLMMQLGNFFIGEEGEGIVSVSDGGRVESHNMLLARRVGSEGHVEISGAGSSWATATFTVGLRGDGSLLVRDGASLTAPNASAIGGQQGASGEMTLEGAGTEVLLGNTLSVGGSGSGSGTGVLTLRDGALLQADNSIMVGRNTGSEGTLIIGAADGEDPVAPGTLSAPELLIGFAGGSGRLVLNHDADDLELPAITGSEDAVVDILAGTTKVSGTFAARSFDGQARLASGATLIVDGDFRGDGHLTLDPGSVLGGSGRVVATTSTGATIMPGSSPGTLTVTGDLLLDSASTLVFELGDPAGEAGVDSDLIEVQGDLTLDGSLDVIALPDFGAGTYRLINYAGGLTDNGLDLGDTPAGFDPDEFEIQTATANQVNLLVPGPLLLSFWDGEDDPNNGVVGGGDGIWTATATNWTNAGGTLNAAYDPDALLTFGAPGGTVTVDGSEGAIHTSGMQFAADGYVLEGDRITFTTGIAQVRVGDGTSDGAGFTAAIDNELAAPDGFDKRDLGTLLLTGDSTFFSGVATVREGTLLVDGSLGGTINVEDGARLGGTGSLGVFGGGNGFLTTPVTIRDGGTIAPGRSIGTLTVAGDLIFEAGSIYEVEVNDGGNEPGVNNDHLDVGGTATISDEAGVHVLAENGTDDGSTYQPVTRYTILTAAGGRTGEFDPEVAHNFAFLDAELDYDPNNVYLILSRDIAVAPTFCIAGSTLNQCNTAEGAESQGPGGAIYDAVVGLNEAQALDAFDRLSGEIHATARGVMLEDSRFLREAATNRVRAAFANVGSSTMPVMGYGPDGAAPAAADTELMAVWGHAFGSWGRWNGDGNAARFGRSIGGFFLGADAPVADRARLGLLGGYSRSNVELSERVSSASVDSYHLGILWRSRPRSGEPDGRRGA